jgi:hypothetical protein
MIGVTMAAPGRVECRDRPEPEITESGMAIVKVTRAGICGSDLLLWDGRVEIEDDGCRRPVCEVLSRQAAELAYVSFSRPNAPLPMLNPKPETAIASLRMISWTSSVGTSKITSPVTVSPGLMYLPLRKER